MKYRFYFEDDLQPVYWWDSPDNLIGPWDTARAALTALENSGIAIEPNEAGYILMTEEQVRFLQRRIYIP